jgi:hypothetical protein
VFERIAALGMEVVGQSPEALAETCRAEQPVRHKQLQQAGIRPERVWVGWPAGP